MSAIDLHARLRHYHNGSGNLFNTINSYCAYFKATWAGPLFGFSHLCIINYILTFFSQCWCHLPSGQHASQWRMQRHDQNTQGDIRTPDSSNSSAVGRSRETSNRSWLGFVFEACLQHGNYVICVFSGADWKSPRYCFNSRCVDV